VTRIRSLGWKPRIDLQRGIRDAAEAEFALLGRS
jgi:nucleoside-diphosphate-sugar epimerase